MSNSRIKAAFQDGKAFIPFVTCGDPSLETTKKIVAELAQAGAAVIELGIPFSDPTAEGPVIQSANMRALGAGTTTDKVFDMVADLRKTVDTPFVFMTYANVVFHYGIEKFCVRAAEAGVDGLILPDVPFEEKEEFAGPCRKHGIDLISMIAPTSEERIDTIAREAEGFIYCVSSLGVTFEHHYRSGFHRGAHSRSYRSPHRHRVRRLQSRASGSHGSKERWRHCWFRYREDHCRGRRKCRFCGWRIYP